MSKPDMELGHWVTGSMGHLPRPGHRVIILTPCESRVFPVFSKMPKMQNSTTLTTLNEFLFTYFLTLSSTRVLDKILDIVLEH